MAGLNKNILIDLKEKEIEIPPAEIFALPERILQFGTGVLLRGLPDYFVDKANKQGLFNGRIVVVKSTSGGEIKSFAEQENLYTICVRGLESGISKQEYIINASISRVLDAKSDWDSILQCAGNDSLEIIISNTTEVGVTYLEENISVGVPVSYPGKLLAFLLKRFQVCKGDSSGGFIIIPTELLVNNAEKLKAILVRLAKFNQLEEDFVNWMLEANSFCNSLVDRIVPGRLQGNDLTATQKLLGYTDELMIMAEPFRLWAIEAPQKIKDRLSFYEADDGVKIVEDITKFRELKLRLLNGTHTFCSGIGALAGFEFVREAMIDESFLNYVNRLVTGEIIPLVISGDIKEEEAIDFYNNVIERFKNPFLNHKWISITLQYSSKMSMRNLPLIIKHYESSNKPPLFMAFGFAAYIVFMHTDRASEGSFIRSIDGENVNVEDSGAAVLFDAWQSSNVVDAVLSNKGLWNVDLTVFPGFSDAVRYYLDAIVYKGVMAAIDSIDEYKS